MSHVRVQMQSLSMMVLVHIFKPWCKCLLVGMPWYKCPLVSMPWCECSDVNIIYSKISFIFKTRLSSVPETQNIFKNLIYYSWKVIFLFIFFDLKLSKNWWSLLENLQRGIDLESGGLAQQIYFHNLVEQRGGSFPWSFPEKMNSLKIKHLKRFIIFFLVSKYGNLTCVKTYHDRLNNLGKKTLG